MDNLIFALNVVLPLLIIMIFGYFLRRIGIITQPFLKVANKVCFSVLFPLLIFKNVYGTDLSESFSPRMIGFAIGSILIIIGLLFLIIPRVVKNKRKVSVLIQAMFRCNFVLFGMPIAQTMFGDAGVGTAAILAAFVVPVFNFFAVLTLEVFTQRENGRKFNLKGALWNICKNPHIIATLVAVLFLLLHIPVPSPVNKAVNDLAGAATPIALLVLGADFKFGEVKKNLRYILSGTLVRLVVVPSIMLSISVALGFRGYELGSLTILYAGPVAVTSYIMAQQAKADDELAGQLVVFTSLFSTLTVFFFVFLFRTLGLF